MKPLRNLRPEGSTKRAIPQGYGFSLVSCANYLFETIAWTVIAVMTGSYAGECECPFRSPSRAGPS